MGVKAKALRSTAATGYPTDWWTKVLAGAVQPHPTYGDAISVKLRGRGLHLSGELASEEERDTLIREARRFIGRGLDDVDARRLVVKRNNGAQGIYEQTIIAAFPNPGLAEQALKFMRQQSRRLQPKEMAIVKSDRDPVLSRLGEFATDARKALAAGNGIVIIRVDETDAFDAREILDEDTHSVWTLATPPTKAKR